jgi:protein gp37
MGADTAIEWTESTWNPVRGCTRVSPGCGGSNHQGGCYAEKIAARFSDLGQPFHGFAERTANGGRWTGRLALVEGALDLPRRWRKPRRIFVNSMSDLFHENLPDEAIDRVFGIMALAPQHTFQVLTKRAERMREHLSPRRGAAGRVLEAVEKYHPLDDRNPALRGGWQWPLPNVWLGVSVEDQERADERIPHLLETPAAVRFLSCEPLLSQINLRRISTHGGWYDALSGWRDVRESPVPEGVIQWVIVGGESGPRSRPLRANWVRSLVRQCHQAEVPCFVKQMGHRVIDRNDAGFDGCEPTSWPDMDPFKIEHDIHGYREEYQGADCLVTLEDHKGGDMAEWPEDLRVRQFPK